MKNFLTTILGFICSIVFFVLLIFGGRFLEKTVDLAFYKTFGGIAKKNKKQEKATLLKKTGEEYYFKYDLGCDAEKKIIKIMPLEVQENCSRFSKKTIELARIKNFDSSAKAKGKYTGTLTVELPKTDYFISKGLTEEIKRLNSSDESMPKNERINKLNRLMNEFFIESIYLLEKGKFLSETTEINGTYEIEGNEIKILEISKSIIF